MTAPTVTPSRDRTEDDSYHARIARSLADGRAAFYARQGLTPPPKPEVGGSSSNGLGLPAGESVPDGARRTRTASVAGPLWSCARDACTKTFRLGYRQRAKFNQGRRNFYCSKECYNLSRTERDHYEHTRISVEALGRVVAESGLEYRDIAERLGWYKTKRNGRKFPDAGRVKVTLGLQPSRKGGHCVSTVRRTTVDKFTEALNLPEEWWVD
jgi:hypothetical protein